MRIVHTALINSVSETYTKASKTNKMQISNFVVDRILENGRFLKAVGPSQWTAISKGAARIKVAQCIQYHNRKIRVLSASTGRIADCNDNHDAADFIAHAMLADEGANEEDHFHVDHAEADNDFQYTTTAMCKTGSCQEKRFSLKDLLGKSGSIFPVRSDLPGHPMTFQTPQGCYKFNGESGGTGFKFNAEETMDKQIGLALEAVENELIRGDAWAKAKNLSWCCDSE